MLDISPGRLTRSVFQGDTLSDVGQGMDRMGANENKFKNINIVMKLVRLNILF